MKTHADDDTSSQIAERQVLEGNTFNRYKKKIKTDLLPFPQNTPC